MSLRDLRDSVEQLSHKHQKPAPIPQKEPFQWHLNMTVEELQAYWQQQEEDTKSRERERAQMSADVRRWNKEK